MLIRNMLLFVLCAGVLREGAAIAQSQSHQPDPVVERLERGKPIERQIHTDDVHTYAIELKAGDFARGIVDHLAAARRLPNEPFGRRGCLVQDRRQVARCPAPALD